MPKTETKTSDNRPFRDIRYHNIRATIWKNPTSTGSVLYNVTVSRHYRDDKGEWKDTGSFGFDDLGNLSLALQDAHSVIARTIEAERQESKSADRA